MKVLRTLIALPLFLLSAVTLVTAVWNFATAVIYGHAGDVVIGFMYCGIAALATVLMSVIAPKAPTKMSKIKTLTIPADPAHALTRDTLDRSLAALQAAVGGPIEDVGHGPNWTAWADEEGKLKRRPYNVRATHAMAFLAGHNIGDPIVGDVVVTGHTPDGEPADLAADVADRVESVAKEVTL